MLCMDLNLVHLVIILFDLGKLGVVVIALYLRTKVMFHGGIFPRKLRQRMKEKAEESEVELSIGQLIEMVLLFRILAEL